MIIQDVDKIEPSVYPVLRGETSQQGKKELPQVGSFRS